MGFDWYGNKEFASLVTITGIIFSYQTILAREAAKSLVREEPGGFVVT